jgi:hypothetical protein
MAHYALLDENNTVTNVITGVDEDITQTDLDGTVVGGSSEAWEQFYATRPWLNAESCKRTSYNNNIRKQYAGIGYTYDSTNDVFIEPQPFASWSLDKNFDWQAPTPRPAEGFWYWDEDTLSWIEIEDGI